MPWLIPRLLVSWKLVEINDQDTQISTTKIDKKKFIDINQATVTISYNLNWVKLVKIFIVKNAV